MDLRPTEAEVAHQCRNVTPTMREFCISHMGFRNWPELLIQGADKERGDNLLAVEPFSEAQWWEIIIERVDSYDETQ